jgi:LPS sulfotransferase NodH
VASNIEQLLISSVINTSDHITAASKGITSKFFHSHPEEWNWIERYISQHRKAPSKTAFRSKFPGTKIIKGATDTGHFCDEVPYAR